MIFVLDCASIPEIITIASKFSALRRNTTIYEEVFINPIGVTRFLTGQLETFNRESYITNGGKVTAEDIKNLNIKAKVIFLNACQVSRDDMANAFLNAGNPKRRYYIAPRKDVPFDETFIVALLFYKRALLDRRPKFFSALKYVYNLKDIKTNYWLWKGP